MTAPHTDDEFTELADAHINRVDLVGSPANGRAFLLRKAADDGLLKPLVAPEQVAALIAKADQETPVTDPANPIEKAEIDVTDAPQPDDLIPTPPGGSTANSLPGSADWEQLDGDTAMNAVAVLGRLKGVLGWLADREAQEAVTNGGGDDADNSWDLDDMACSLDWMIGRLAAFAVGEHMEAEEVAEIGKACADLAGALPVVEGLAPIAKAGRTLSAANETELRNAAASIEKVLNSLPAAPEAADVTKTEETPAVTDIPDPAAELLAKAVAALPRLTAVDLASALLAGGRTQEIAKAKGDPQMAVFSADGKLVGVIDPADLNPIAATEAPAQGDTEGSGDDAQADAPADDTATTPAPAAAEAPAADDSRVIPGTDTVQAPAQQPDDTQTPAVTKTADPAQLEELRTQVAEEVRKNAELADVVKALEEQVRKFGLTPDDRRSPVLNGGTGTPGAATRDQNADTPLADVMKAIDEEPDPVKRDELRKAAFFAGVRARFEQG